MNNQSNRAQWSNAFVFILAAAGSAVGLGNIWKFPYIAGVNGGGAFVLVYLICLAVIALPLFMAELYIGQASQSNAVTAFDVMHKKGSPWKGVGGLAVLTAFLIMAFYSVVGGWVLDFAYRSVINEFATQKGGEISGLLGALFENPYRQVFWHFVFIALTTGVIFSGIRKGLERWNKILMPALILLLLGLLVRALFLSGCGEALDFLFKPDFDKLTAKGVLEAVGHSFFTVGLAMGIIITYGSYFKSKNNLFKVALTVCVLDTVIALLAGIVIFSVVFTYGVEPGAGPALIFKTLPMLFVKMPGGYVVAVAFFMLVAFAALTSGMSLVEVIVTFWIEKFKMSRLSSALIVSALIFLLGILCALSFNVLSDVKIIGLNIFDLFDRGTSSLFLPLGGILTALFFGWVLDSSLVRQFIGDKGWHKVVYFIFLWIMRVVAPVALTIILVKGLMDW